MTVDANAAAPDLGRGEAGQRQIPNARIGLAQNGGGQIANDAAAMCVSILTL